MDWHKFASNEEFDEFFNNVEGGAEHLAILKDAIRREFCVDVSDERVTSLARRLVEDKVAEMIKGEE